MATSMSLDFHLPLYTVADPPVPSGFPNSRSQYSIEAILDSHPPTIKKQTALEPHAFWRCTHASKVWTDYFFCLLCHSERLVGVRKLLLKATAPPPTRSTAPCQCHIATQWAVIGDCCIKVLMGRSMQALPWVTHRKDLCKIRHQLPMGRNYATCVLHKYTIFTGRIHAKVKKSRYLLMSL